MTDTALTVPEPEPATALTLFRTDTPSEVVQRATDVANALKPIIEQQKLYANIQGKKHVLVEGWTLLGSLVGVFPVLTWSRRTDNGYEARVEARTRDGAVVGAAEAECSRDERRWKTADDYAIRSMAATRATSKALRMPLGFIATLAGYSATPAEEITHDAEIVEEPEERPRAAAGVVNEIVKLLAETGVDPQLLRDTYKVETLNDLTPEKAAHALERLRARTKTSERVTSSPPAVPVPETTLTGSEVASAGADVSTSPPLRDDGWARDNAGEPPLSDAQRKKLMVLCQERGLNDETRKDRAGVNSFNVLTKKQAGQLIEELEQGDLTLWPAYGRHPLREDLLDAFKATEPDVERRQDLMLRTRELVVTRSNADGEKPAWTELTVPELRAMLAHLANPVGVVG